MKSSFRNILLYTMVALTVTTMVYCGQDASLKTEETPKANTYLNHGDSAQYVGMDQCKLCHQQIYQSFLETGMGKSFDKASKTKSAASFGEHVRIYDKYTDLYYHPYWDHDSLKIMEFRLKGKDTTYKRIEKVDYIIGSGQHTNSHIFNTNGYLHQMPMTFYTQKKEWDLPPGFENGANTRFSRKIGLECMSCHNSFPEFVEGSENKFSNLPTGISCERCHGPGSIHVQQRMSGSKVDTSRYIDYSIVNPGKLPIDLQFDVCQRCHLQGNTVLKPGKSFYDFRPGMKLSDYMSTFLPRYENADDEFIMASHADRLKQSQCFIQSFKPTDTANSLRPYKNALTCVTCHNPHVSVRKTGSETFNNACQNCHSGQGKKACSESDALRAKQNNSCVSCHMPRSGSIDIPHVSVHDHYIRKPLKKEEVNAVKKFIGLRSINEAHPDELTMAKAYLLQYDKFEYKTEYLDSAQKYLQDGSTELVLRNFHELIHLQFIRGNFAGILGYVNKLGQQKVLQEVLKTRSWDNADAWASYRIGESYYNSGDMQDAALFYRKADELAPYNPEFKNKLGVSMLAQQRLPEAIASLSAAVTEDPKYVQAVNNLGYAFLMSGDVGKAETLYNQALKLDPDYEMLLMNLAGLHIFKKEYKQAKQYLDRVLKKNPANQQAKQVMEQLNSLK